MIWDKDGAPPAGDWTIALWREFASSDAHDTVSIPMLVEEQADTLRARYLAWVHNLGEAQINGRRVVDHMELRPGFSYWWTHLGIRKCDHVKLPLSYTAIRALAVEGLVRAKSKTSLILVTSDRCLIAVFRSWCQRAGLKFELRFSASSQGQKPVRQRMMRMLPHMLQALVYMAGYVWQRWPLRLANSECQETTDADVAIVDYLDNLDPKAFAEGCFSSAYWGKLPTILTENGLTQDWLHMYVAESMPAPAHEIHRALSKLGKTGVGGSWHRVLESAISGRVVLGAFRDYWRIVRFWRGLRGVKKIFFAESSQVNLWPIFKNDWNEGFLGPTAVGNALFLNLVEAVLRAKHPRKIGMYLQENQGWEAMLIYAWRAAGHGTLLGVQHSTVRYWDLRYFFDPRSYVSGARNALPRPDLVALNGNAASILYANAGYPGDQVVGVEALRYLYLADRRSANIGERGRSEPLRVLVLGDFLPSNSRQQMSWLVQAIENSTLIARVIVKPHPNCPISAGDYPSINAQITDERIETLFANCDVAYTSNVTSAAADAYFANVPIISVLDPRACNMSPLRGLKGVVFVSSPAELAQAFETIRKPDQYLSAKEYFNIDPTIPRWRALLRHLATS